MLKGQPPTFRNGKCSHCGFNERRQGGRYCLECHRNYAQAHRAAQKWRCDRLAAALTCRPLLFLRSGRYFPSVKKNVLISYSSKIANFVHSKTNSYAATKPMFFASQSIAAATARMLVATTGNLISSSNLVVYLAGRRQHDLPGHQASLSDCLARHSSGDDRYVCPREWGQ